MEDNENKENHSSEDPVDMMMFGSRSREKENVIQQESAIDFNELMVNIDKLVESTKNLKPLFHKFYPIIQQWWKKE